MRIKELSEITNLSISTIRYYEKLGLILPVKQGYYKQYTTEIKEQLLLLQKLHWAGLKLTDIKVLFSLQEKEPNQLNLEEIKQIKNMIGSSIQIVVEKQENLLKAKTMLERMFEKVNMLYENRK